MSESRHDRIDGQLVGYALNELTAVERDEVDAHLSACAVCTTELRNIQESLALMAETSSPEQPSPALEHRVLAEFARQSPEAVSVVSAPAEFEVPVLRPAVRWGVLAAGAVIAALAGTLYVVESSRQQLADQAQRASAELTTVREQMERYRTQTDLALAILSAPDMRELALAGRGIAAAAAARAYWSPSRGLLLAVDRLPAPPAGRAYQVWVIDNGQPASAGMLDDPGSGRGMLVVPPPRRGPGSAVTIAITDEPPGGRPTPSGTIALAGTVS